MRNPTEEVKTNKMANTKRKKRSSEIAIQIQENEKLYNDQIEESKKLLQLKEQEYNNKISKLTDNVDQFKRDIISKAGRLLEKLGLEKTDQISTRLTKDFKGYIDRGYLQTCCEPRWKRVYTTPIGHGPWKQGSPKHFKMLSDLRTEPLTKQETEYVQAHEKEVERDERIADLLYHLTGKNLAEQGQVISETPKGTDFRKILAERSAEHMLKLAKQMTPSAIDTTMWDLRTLRVIADKFGDILYEERELRKKKAEMESA
jgi:hypothetical protein